tara:strand:+ start:4037 stop:4594 length:558 start_codon:yes stop_codon:yes gene_type:complete
MGNVLVIKKSSKKSILASARILEIAEEVGISLESAASGNFTHRCVCPSKEHKHGAERTPSLYIDSVKNNFYCFGCGASSNVIDFYMMCHDIDFSESLTQMSKYVKEGEVFDKIDDVKESIYPTLLKISSLFRGALRSNYHDREWLFSIMEKTDEHIMKIDRFDTPRATKLLRKLNKIFISRYGDL